LVYFCPGKRHTNMSKAEKTKNFIIEKAAPIFNTKGYAGTSLADMTAATGLTKGGIYGNFAAFDFNLNKVLAVISREMEKPSTIRGKLLVYGQVYSHHSNYPFPTGGCPILNTAIDSDDTHDELRKKAAAGINRWKKDLTALIEEGVENGEFRKDTPAEQMALTIIALVEGCLMISKATGKPGYRKAIMKSLEILVEQMD
jgi:TetR/AcrR family transcriptional repressor of nem operon